MSVLPICSIYLCLCCIFVFVLSGGCETKCRCRHILRLLRSPLPKRPFGNFPITARSPIGPKEESGRAVPQPPSLVARARPESRARVRWPGSVESFLQQSLGSGADADRSKLRGAVLVPPVLESPRLEPHPSAQLWEARLLTDPLARESQRVERNGKAKGEKVPDLIGKKKGCGISISDKYKRGGGGTVSCDRCRNSIASNSGSARSRQQWI